MNRPNLFALLCVLMLAWLPVSALEFRNPVMPGYHSVHPCVGQGINGPICRILFRITIFAMIRWLWERSI